MGRAGSGLMMIVMILMFILGPAFIAADWAPLPESGDQHSKILLSTRLSTGPAPQAPPSLPSPPTSPASTPAPSPGSSDSPGGDAGGDAGGGEIHVSKSSGGGLSGGAKAGISIAVIFGVAIAVGSFFVLRTKRKNDYRHRAYRGAPEAML